MAPSAAAGEDDSAPAADDADVSASDWPFFPPKNAPIPSTNPEDTESQNRPAESKIPPKIGCEVTK